jgi:hypothetical protein
MLSLPIAQWPDEGDVPLYTGSVEEDLRCVSRAGLGSLRSQERSPASRHVSGLPDV